MNKIKKLDIIVPLLLLVYSLVYYLEVRSLANPDMALLLIEPVFFILVASVAIHITLQLKNRKENEDEQKDKGIDKSQIKKKETIYFCLSTLIYVFMLGILGFIVSTIIYTLFLMYLLGVKSMKILIPIPVVLITILYISLEVWLNIPLPKGFLI